jgi:hypothetical protein
MATWKKVIVSGSAGNFTTIQVDNLTSGVVVGAAGTLSTTAINGTSTIVATTNASGLTHSGSFSGSFQGNGAGLTGVTATPIFPVSQLTPLLSTSRVFVNDGSTNFYSNVSQFQSASWAGVTGDILINGSGVATIQANAVVLSTDISGFGTGVATALGTNVGSAGSVVVNGGALGTPSSGTLTNATGLPISTGVSGLGTGIATFLATPSSANLASALTDETGTAGSVVFSAGPTLTGTTNVANLAATGNVTIAGNLNVSGLISGSATYISSTNVAVTDQFILLASGSGTVVDAGIIVNNDTGTMNGEAFYWENNVTGTNRWAIASGVAHNAVTVTAAEYMVSAKTAAGAPAAAPTYGGATNGFGQMYVNSSNGDIFIYS